jgi:hypothetical protein
MPANEQIDPVDRGDQCRPAASADIAPAKRACFGAVPVQRLNA